MEIIFKQYDTVVSVKKDFDDVSLEEVFHMINTALIGVSWQQCQIDEYIIEKAESLNQDNNGKVY